jgi:hypothetical protein
MKKENHVFDLRLPRNEMAVVDEVAKIADMSVSEVCNVLIAFGILRARSILRQKKKAEP